MRKKQELKRTASRLVKTAKEQGLVTNYLEWCETDEAKKSALSPEEVEYYTKKFRKKGGSEMKYKIGDKMFYVNKRTNETQEVEIIGVKYVFNKRISQSTVYTEDQIDNLIAEGKLLKDQKDYLNKKISDIEKEFGIKLKIE